MLLILTEAGVSLPDEASTLLKGDLSALGPPGVHFGGTAGMDGTWVSALSEFAVTDTARLPHRMADGINFYDAFRHVRYRQSRTSPVLDVGPDGSPVSGDSTGVPYELEAHVVLEWTPSAGAAATEPSVTRLVGAVSPTALAEARSAAYELGDEADASRKALEDLTAEDLRAKAAVVAARAAGAQGGEDAARDAAEAVATRLSVARANATTAANKAGLAALIADLLDARSTVELKNDAARKAGADASAQRSLTDAATARFEEAQAAADAAQVEADATANLKDDDAIRQAATQRLTAAAAALLDAKAKLDAARSDLSTATETNEAANSELLEATSRRDALMALVRSAGATPPEAVIRVTTGTPIRIDVKDVPLVELSLVNHPGAIAVTKMLCQDLVGTNATVADDPNAGSATDYCASNPASTVWMDSVFTTPLGVRVRLAPAPDWAAFGLSAELSTVALGDSGWFSQTLPDSSEPGAGLVAPFSAVAGMDLQAVVGGTRLTFLGGGGAMLIHGVSGLAVRPFLGFNVSVPITSVTISDGTTKESP